MCKLSFDKLRGMLPLAGASNPNILEIYVSGHNPPAICVWTIIPKWDYDIEVSVSKTLTSILARASEIRLDPLIIPFEIKDEMLPAGAQKVYEKS